MRDLNFQSKHIRFDSAMVRKDEASFEHKSDKSEKTASDGQAKSSRNVTISHSLNNLASIRNGHADPEGSTTQLDETKARPDDTCDN
jgi:triphosphoribosyl-dephospho-CoA synthetase